MIGSHSYRYRVVDVFAERPLEGNPLAVFPDACGLDDVTMQRIARELNLSETAFVVPPTREGCLVRVRIFTPVKEMEFAGHPTIGTSFVLMEEGILPRHGCFLLDEKVGCVPIQIEPGDRTLISLSTPPIHKGRFYDRTFCAHILGLDLNDVFDIPPQLLSAGNPTIYIALKHKEAVDRAWLDIAGSKTLKGKGEPLCVFVFTPTLEGAYSRMFAPEYGIAEDPATGSSTGPLAVFMMQNKLLPSASDTSFLSEQGTKMGRRSILHVRIYGDEGLGGIQVGGYVVPIIEAVIKL
jgi:trans-2,3-dihydro-3-hydroxyanthranilate isomerase